MSAQQHPSNIATIGFIVALSIVCSTILSLLASVLAGPQMEARDLDRSKQMMIAAHIMSPNGYFISTDKDGKEIPAKADPNGYLVPGSKEDIADRSQIISVYRHRFIPYLSNDKGELITFEKAGLQEDVYLDKYKKQGYYRQSLKLIYAVLPNDKQMSPDAKPIGYIIPVNGFGLWDAIYGYLAIAPDGNTVIGTTWYEQKETPGLGANIAEASWQEQFSGKDIFQASPDGETDFKLAPLGIIVVRGKVAEVLGNAPKAKSAVDGMAGATLTGNGVTKAYKDVLNAYRPFLLRLHEEKSK